LEERYQGDILSIKKDCYKMAWYMRGAVSITEAMMLSYDDRKLMNTIIEENLDTTKKSGLPFF